MLNGRIIKNGEYRTKIEFSKCRKRLGEITKRIEPKTREAENSER